MPASVNNLLVWGIAGIEQGTLDQAHLAADLPFVEHPVALMPDAHVGIGATVGSVIATHAAIVPAAVGVDIGCGMIAAPTSLKSTSLPDNLDHLHDLIRASIPAGVGKGFEKSEPWAWSDGLPRPEWAARENQPEIVQNSNKLWRKTTQQFGTLGSGNHFVEVCLDEADSVWIVLHSGSRGVGNQIAQRHIERARRLMKKYFIELDDADLAYFAETTPEFDEYIRDMRWAQAYAYDNRVAMMDAAVSALGTFLGQSGPMTGTTADPFFWHGPFINTHHNYTEQEHHHGKNLWVTRKGAIRARQGDKGIIPGSMATGTYIVEGLGNAASYNSASHGAGRRMSRRKARDTVTEAELTEAMRGKAWNSSDVKTLLDEAPAAYKDVGAVMDAQADLARVTHTLTQILNYKGT